MENEKYKLLPIEDSDFESLYQVACDPQIWAQHPNKDRWRREVFTNFFEGAIQSKGAFKIIDKSHNKVIGSTRMYEYNEEENSILIGYTFYAVEYWGVGANHAVKRMMLDYLFQHVEQVKFHIGATNYRSQISIGRLGATKVKEIEVAYHGEPIKLNYEYVIYRNNYINQEIQ